MKPALDIKIHQLLEEKLIVFVKKKIHRKTVDFIIKEDLSCIS